MFYFSLKQLFNEAVYTCVCKAKVLSVYMLWHKMNYMIWWKLELLFKDFWFLKFVIKWCLSCDVNTECPLVLAIFSTTAPELTHFSAIILHLNILFNGKKFWLIIKLEPLFLYLLHCTCSGSSQHSVLQSPSWKASMLSIHALGWGLGAIHVNWHFAISFTGLKNPTTFDDPAYAFLL